MAIGDPPPQPVADGKRQQHGSDRVGPHDRRRAKVRRQQARRGDLRAQAASAYDEDQQLQLPGQPRSGHARCTTGRLGLPSVDRAAADEAARDRPDEPQPVVNSADTSTLNNDPAPIRAERQRNILRQS